MKYKCLYLFLLLIAILPSASWAISYKDKVVSTSQEVNPVLRRPFSSLTYTPFSQNRDIKKGFRFPYSWGVGVQGFAFSQQYDTKALFIQNEKITAHSDSLDNDIVAGEYQMLIRPEITVLPFLNIYGLFGYVEGNVNPDITAHGIIVEWPFQDTVYEIKIDTSIMINDPMKYNGPVYGIGATASYVFKHFFVELDYNYSVVYPKDMDGNLTTQRLSPKTGYLFASGGNMTEGAVWLGASWMENTQTLTGVVNVREFAGDLADYLGEEADYVATLSAVNKWNMVVGGSVTFNKHYNLALEVGFIGRKKVALGFLYRF